MRHEERTYTNVVSRVSVQRKLVATLSRALDSSNDVEGIGDAVTKEYPLDLAHGRASVEDRLPLGSGPSVLSFGKQFQFEFFTA